MSSIRNLNLVHRTNRGCPFCGAGWHTIEIDEVSLGEKQPFACVCNECGTIGPKSRTQEDAARLWDTRSEKPKDDRAEKACREIAAGHLDGEHDAHFIARCVDAARAVLP